MENRDIEINLLIGIVGSIIGSLFVVWLLTKNTKCDKSVLLN